MGIALAAALCLPLGTPSPALAGPTPAERTARTSASALDAFGPHGRAATIVADMTIAEQAASVVMGHVGGTDPATMAAYMTQGLGGFILMGSNIPATEAELQALTTALIAGHDVPPLIAVDQEGGYVTRLPGDGFAASDTLKDASPEAVEQAFATRGSLVARAGISVNFGTVADVTADTGSFIHGRALGADPAGAAERVAAATLSQEQFVASTLKHFPGHGAAPGDSHHVVPQTSKSLDEWAARDALPFVAGIDAGASLVMFGHLAYTAVDPAPASLSAEWHRILRDELGFTGVAVTDDLGMLVDSGLPEYADPVSLGVTALAAGSDLLLMVRGSDAATAGLMATGVVAAVESGAVPAERLEEAAIRVMTLRLQLAASTARWSLCPDCASVD